MFCDEGNWWYDPPRGVFLTENVNALPEILEDSETFRTLGKIGNLDKAATQPPTHLEHYCQALSHNPHVLS